MMYNALQIDEIKEIARNAKLRATQEFWELPSEELCEICNGIGADWQSESTRKILTNACKCAEATACIHDVAYHFATADLDAQRATDDLFLINGIKETLYKSRSILSWAFLWNTRKVLTAYLILRRLGRIAWILSYFERQQKNEEKK